LLLLLLLITTVAIIIIITLPDICFAYDAPDGTSLPSYFMLLVLAIIIVLDVGLVTPTGRIHRRIIRSFGLRTARLQRILLIRRIARRKLALQSSDLHPDHRQPRVLPLLPPFPARKLPSVSTL
jgi:hypothetical protein